MSKNTIGFIKGHMGGNEILLFNGYEMPRARGLEVSLLALSRPNIGGHQAGLLYASQSKGHVRVKTVDHASGRFISACGGLTQVFGKALVETHLAEELGMKVTEPIAQVALETDVGTIQLRIESKDGKARRIMTNMQPFVNECYRLGVQVIHIDDLVATKVGKFLIININDLRSIFPEVDFRRLDSEPSRIVAMLQEKFDGQGYLESKNADFALYDLAPLRVGNIGRVIFPHRISADSIEPACGTGTVAVGIAMAERGEVEGAETTLELSFESGGDITSIGGPDCTSLRLQSKKGKVVDASFSHSLVEILAVGTLTFHL